MPLIDIDKKVKTILEQTNMVEGHLRKREMEFLAALPFLKEEGHILVIGSFKGKSTIILAKSAIAANRQKIFACDPLTLNCSTDPEDATGKELPDIFFNNLKRHSVEKTVNFSQMKSSELATQWDTPVQVLWIDGDHTYQGALLDFTLFENYLVPGAVVCLHDVLHGFDGPIRVFMEKMLLSEDFGECGLCGSIGWGQFLGKRKATKQQWNAKLNLYTGLSRLVPFAIKSSHGIPSNKHIKKIYKSLVSHGAISPGQWVDQINNYNETN